MAEKLTEKLLRLWVAVVTLVLVVGLAPPETHAASTDKAQSYTEVGTLDYIEATGDLIVDDNLYVVTKDTSFEGVSRLALRKGMRVSVRYERVGDRNRLVHLKRVQ